MRTVAGVVGALLVVAVLWDAFQTVVLPRRASSRFRLTAGFYGATWPPFRALASRRAGARRDNSLGYFGPLSLLALLMLWALALVVAFALCQWGLHSPLAGSQSDTFVDY